MPPNKRRCDRWNRVRSWYFRPACRRLCYGRGRHRSPESVWWARHRLRTTRRVRSYSEWTSLPWIGDAGFADALNCCVREQRIDTVFTAASGGLADAAGAAAENGAQSPAGGGASPGQPSWRTIADITTLRQVPCRSAGTRGRTAVGSPHAAAATGGSGAAVSTGPGRMRLSETRSAGRDLPLDAAGRHCGDRLFVGPIRGRAGVSFTPLRNWQVALVDPGEPKKCIRESRPWIEVFDEAPMDEIFDAFRMNLAPFQGGVNYSRYTLEPGRIQVLQPRAASQRRTFGRTTYAGEVALSISMETTRSNRCGRTSCRGGVLFVRAAGSSSTTIAGHLVMGPGPRPTNSARMFKRECDGGIRRGRSVVCAALWGRLLTCAPIGNRRNERGLATRAQDGILPHNPIFAYVRRRARIFIRSR